MTHDAVTLTAYFAERQRSGNRFLADAVLELCVEQRIAHSVVLRGIAGFGPTNVIRTDRSLSMSEDPPVTVIAVDSAANIHALAESVAAIIGRGVLTVEDGRRAPDVLDSTALVRLSLHLGRRRRIGGTPGYIAVCDVLYRHGFAAADAFLGVDGTHGGARRRARFFSRNADVPLSIAGVGTGSQAGAAIDELRALLPDAWITVESTALGTTGVYGAGTPASVGGDHKLTIHTYESSLHEGRPVHRALIERLTMSGHAGGATVLRAIWGFRHPDPPHGDRLVALTRLVPVTTVLLATATNIDRSRQIVDELTPREGLVTLDALSGMLEIHDGHTRGALRRP